jgi:hypothetical protein
MTKIYLYCPQADSSHYDRPVPFEVAVSEPSKQGSGMNSFVSYKVSCKVNESFTHKGFIHATPAYSTHPISACTCSWGKTPAPFIIIISDRNCRHLTKKNDKAYHSNACMHATRAGHSEVSSLLFGWADRFASVPEPDFHSHEALQPLHVVTLATHGTVPLSLYSCM